MILKLPLFILLFGATSFSDVKPQNDLEYFRQIFHSSKNMEDLQKIIDLSPDASKEFDLQTINAYKAVSETMLAEHTFSVFSKLKHFNNGSKKLDAIIDKSPNAENRYLRLLVQLNVPRMLNYYDMINEDIDFIDQRLNTEISSIRDKRLFKETLLEATGDLELQAKIANIKIY